MKAVYTQREWHKRAARVKHVVSKISTISMFENIKVVGVALMYVLMSLCIVCISYVRTFKDDFDKQDIEKVLVFSIVMLIAIVILTVIIEVV